MNGITGQFGASLEHGWRAGLGGFYRAASGANVANGADRGPSGRGTSPNSRRSQRLGVLCAYLNRGSVRHAQGQAPGAQQGQQGHHHLRRQRQKIL